MITHSFTFIDYFVNTIKKHSNEDIATTAFIINNCILHTMHSIS